MTPTTPELQADTVERLLTAAQSNDETVILYHEHDGEEYEIVVERLDGELHIVRHGRFTRRAPHIYPREIDADEFRRRAKTATDHEII